MQHLWFREDAFLPHTVPTNIRRTLNKLFRNGWFGRCENVEFLPRSPDFTPLHFLIWDYVKNNFYQVEPTTPTNMKRKIDHTC